VTPQDVAATVDLTLLHPEATAAQARALSRDAVRQATRGVCVSPVYVPLAVAEVAGSAVSVVTVAGFPGGASLTAGKVAELRAAAEGGARDVDAVLAYGRLLGGEDAAVGRDVEALAVAARDAGVTLKVILETGHLSPELVDRACRLCVDAGVGWVKTSTGFGPRGASVDDVRRMRAAVGGHAHVKAAGGIRTWDAAAALLDAGADALGCSSLTAVLDGAPARG
jgi:deoxyribose-phosphate aldolase